MLSISEIFYSIQGESTYAGLPCVFVRLAGCDLRCTWCDTAYAFTGGRSMTQAAVLDAVAQTGCHLVEVTGGEPLLQAGVYPLLSALLDARYTVLLETGGHVPAGRVPDGVVRIIDVKCPGSHESHRMCWANLDDVRPTDEVKFVVQDRADYEYARDVIHRYALTERCACVHLSPVHGTDLAALVAAWILEDGLTARLQLQVHKYIWGPDTRGV